MDLPESVEVAEGVLKPLAECSREEVLFGAATELGLAAQDQEAAQRAIDSGDTTRPHPAIVSAGEHRAKCQALTDYAMTMH